MSKSERRFYFMAAYAVVLVWALVALAVVEVRAAQKKSVEYDYDAIYREHIPKKPETFELCYTVPDAPVSVYTVTSEERDLLAKVVHEEGNIESLECQKAIVSVIFNRVDMGIFGGDTIHDVIYEKNQFTVVPLLGRTAPNETNYEAVDYVIQNGSTLPKYVCFFRSRYYFKNYTPYMNLDNTYFSYRKMHKEMLADSK